MGYYEDSFTDIGGLSIHWSSDCNMACQYCYIDKDKHAMAAYNADIRKALEDGSFIQVIKDKTSSFKDQIESLSLWGAEPTLNGKYFPAFWEELIAYFTNCNEFMFSTNAYLGGKVIYDDFVVPIMNYCEQNQKIISFDLQFSLDGPEYFNDISRRKGATQHTLQAIKDVVTQLPKDLKYFKLNIATKATLDVSYMKIMADEGLSGVQKYYDFWDQIQRDINPYTEGIANLQVSLSTVPTIVIPGYHTVEDGKTFAKWVSFLPQVDKTKWLNPMKPLILQPYLALDYYLTGEYNMLAEARNIFSCSAGKNNFTIDHEGNFYSCNRLCRNSAMPDHLRYSTSMQTNTTIDSPSPAKWTKRVYALSSFHDSILSRKYMFDAIIMELAYAGQIKKDYLWDDDQRLLLFYCLVGHYCHIGSQEDHTQSPNIISTSSVKYFGNGAVDALMTYYKHEKKAGVF